MLRYVKKYTQSGWAMAPSVKCLLHKPEDWVWTPRIHIKTNAPSAIMHHWNLRAPVMRWNVGTGESAEAHGPAALAYAPVPNEAEVPALALIACMHTHRHPLTQRPGPFCV